MNQRDVRRDFRRQRRHHVGIKLNRGHVRHAGRQPQRQRSRSRPDLDKPIIDAGAIASTSFSAHADSRKCWP